MGGTQWLTVMMSGRRRMSLHVFSIGTVRV